MTTPPFFIRIARAVLRVSPNVAEWKLYLEVERRIGRKLEDEEMEAIFTDITREETPS